MGFQTIAFRFYTTVSIYLHHGSIAQHSWQILLEYGQYKISILPIEVTDVIMTV
jgi:hypothetical protein